MGIHTGMSFGKRPLKNVPGFWSLEKMSFKFRPSYECPSHKCP